MESMEMVKGKEVEIEYKTFNSVPELKMEIHKSFSIFNSDFYFRRCAFLFADSMQVLEKIIFGILNSVMMDYKIDKLDFIEAAINKEHRDSQGNFTFTEEAKVDLHFIECFVGSRKEFDEKYQSVENLEGS